MHETILTQLLAKKIAFPLDMAEEDKKDDERVFDLLNSKIVNCCYRVNDILPSLSLYTDVANFK